MPTLCVALLLCSCAEVCYNIDRLLHRTVSTLTLRRGLRRGLDKLSHAKVYEVGRFPAGPPNCSCVAIGQPPAVPAIR